MEEELQRAGGNEVYLTEHMSRMQRRLSVSN